MADLKQLLKDNGVVGAGGAGFPSYCKLAEGADTLLINAVECEPLLRRKFLRRFHKTSVKNKTVSHFCYSSSPSCTSAHGFTPYCFVIISVVT